jgi:glc operon protein GlcG
MLRRTEVAISFITTLFVAVCAPSVHAQPPSKQILTLSAARQIVDAAAAEASKRKATVVIAVVDDGGHLLVLNRLDDTQVASVEVGIAKARTAAIFRRPSKVFEDQVRDGRIAALALPGATALQGGLPITYEGKVIGAIGVSGNTPQEDEDIAKAGVAVAQPIIAGAAGNVTYLNHAEVAAAFAKGRPLIEVPEYKVHASRRSADGQVEVHEHETDVVYVLDGTATLVTGGEPIDAKTVSPGEIRAANVRGGETRKLAKGDVVIIPPNTPHWFKEVSDPFLYFVVKPIQQ